MKRVRLPSKMLEHVKEHGDPETIIPFVIRVHLDAVKKNVEEMHKRHPEMYVSTVSALSFLFL